MPTLKFKNGVHINGRHFDPEVRRILDVVRITAPKMVDGAVWVTSANDGTHEDGSKHFTDEAFDVRVRNLKGFKWGPDGRFFFCEEADAWAKRIRFELGSAYDVVYGDEDHIDHIHVELDAKT